MARGHILPPVSDKLLYLQKLLWRQAGNFLKHLVKSRFAVEAALEGNAMEGEVAEIRVFEFFLEVIHAVLVDVPVKILA